MGPNLLYYTTGTDLFQRGLIVFNPESILRNMESLRRSNGAFIAAPSEDYRTLWIRDHLFMAFSYWYLGRNYYEKLVQSLQIVFNIFHKQRHKLERIIHPRDQDGRLIIPELIHAKYNPDNLNEVTREWSHHQLDAIGLFLHIVADLSHKHIRVVRDRGDEEILQLLVFYLQNVHYWSEPDNGIWEEHLMSRSSSIGAVVGGLSYVQRRGLAAVPSELITKGRNELRRILPFESRDVCDEPRHSHDCDAAQLFLLWPFNVVELEMADVILSRIADGHRNEQGDFHKLVQPLGINRYWGDDYRRSQDGVSAQWQWDFLVSIIFAQRHEYEKATAWFKRGAERITPEGYITEAFYSDGRPNDHTPLGWMLALALIAFSKLPPEFQEKVLT